MKKILQIVSYFYPHIGGIEKVAKDIAYTLRDNEEVEQKVFCFNIDAEAGEYHSHKKETLTERVEGIDVIRCGSFAKVASQSLSLSVKKQLKKVMDEWQPDVVIFHYPNPFLARYLLKHRKKNFELFLYWHLDITKQKLLGKLFHRQTLRLIDRAKGIIATSPNYIEHSPFLSKAKEKCTIISCCVSEQNLVYDDGDEKRANEVREEFKGKTICFALGRHVEYKGYRYLIEAATYLPENFVVLIGGTGALTEELKAQAHGQGNVRFLGKLLEEDLKKYLLACDIFCFPSITRNEAFGIALAEGMYFEKPAVTFTIEGSGVNYVNLDGVTGIECPNRDSKAYAEALITLSQDKALCERYGKNGKQRVIDNFTYKIFAEKINALIK